jgi:hypothetical protein
MPDLKEEYETDDIYLAAYFMICGCVMERRKKLGNKVLFIFTNPGGSIKDLREAYYSGKAKVSAIQFQHQIVSCKKMCFD